MGKLKVTLVSSIIGKKPAQRKTIKALGLRKINQTVEHIDNAKIRGMIEKTKHMVRVEEI